MDCYINNVTVFILNINNLNLTKKMQNFNSQNLLNNINF